MRLVDRPGNQENHDPEDAGDDADDEDRHENGPGPGDDGLRRAAQELL
jgi:hypothetical protein